MYPLPHLGVIAIAGEDAAAFVNAQCCNVLPEAGALRLNAWCNAAGQVIATFLLLRHEQHFYLLLPAVQIARVIQGLRLYILRARVELRNASSEYRLSGTDQDGAHALLRQSGTAVQWSAAGDFASAGRQLAMALPYAGQRYLLLSPASAPMPEMTGNTSRWQCMDLLCGMPWLHSASSERFLPQQLNLDLLQGLSLEKGCYPGQEVIARLHYRGQLTRRLFLLRAEGALSTAPPAACLLPLQSASGQACGHAIACLQDDRQQLHLQAVLSLDREQPARVFLATNPEVALAVRAPPSHTAAD